MSTTMTFQKTARNTSTGSEAGKEGKVINLLAQRDHDNFTRVLHDNDVDIQKAEKPYIQKVEIKWRQESSGPRGGYNGPRGSGPRRGGRGFGPRRH